VKTKIGNFYSDNIVICAGGMTRNLLKSAGIPVKIYFSHAELIVTSPVNLQLNTIVAPANLQRLQLENESTQNDQLWRQSDYEIVPPILDVGAVQFMDGSLRLGQISRAITNPYTQIDANYSEKWLRENIMQMLPALGNLPGTWHHCLVAFTDNKLPLIGRVSELENIYIFSGFSSPFMFVLPLAERYAKFLAGEQDEVISQLLMSNS
jgi:glycine/D-amino acid oxidase-like deaminating enzyme